MIKWILLGVMVVVAVGCEKAKYRSWKAGDDHFLGRENHRDSAKNEVVWASSPKYRRGQCQFPYSVRSGDSLSLIAKRCDVNMLHLADHNLLMPPFHLDVGQVLYFGQNKQSKQLSEVRASTEFELPAKKQTEVEFKKDNQGRHAMVMKMPIGTPIFPIKSGKVVYAGNALKAFGKMILVKHDNGLMSVYAHNAKLLVEEGDIVNGQRMLALSGSSGYVEEPSLYIELRYKGRKADIKPFFEAKT